MSTPEIPSWDAPAKQPDPEPEIIFEEAQLPTKETIRRYVMKDAEAEEKRHKKVEGVYHASEVWKCYRRGWYSWKGFVATDPLPHGLFHMGKVVEQIGFEALKMEHGEAYVHKLPVKYVHNNGEWTLVGESDPCLIGPNLQVLVVHEFKTSARGAKAEPHGGYYHQASIYAHLLNAPEIRIVQPSRNDILDCAETIVGRERIKKLFEESVEYFKMHHMFLKSDTPPLAMPMMEFECDYCPFKGQCVKDGGWTLTQRVITRGKNKGTTVNEWVRDAPAIEQTLEGSV